MAHPVTISLLRATALHPSSWDAWIPEKILNQIVENVPPGTSFSISCLPGEVWIVVNEKDEVLLSSDDVEIVPDPEPEPEPQPSRDILSILKFFT